MPAFLYVALIKEYALCFSFWLENIWDILAGLSQSFSDSLSQAFEDCLVFDGLLEKHNNDIGL